jgi:hypothetical protein
VQSATTQQPQPERRRYGSLSWGEATILVPSNFSSNLFYRNQKLLTTTYLNVNDEADVGGGKL